MTLNPCPDCGGMAAISAEQTGRIFVVRAVCTQCGKRGRKSLDKQQPADGAASVYWAGMSWNCGLFEEEGKA